MSFEWLRRMSFSRQRSKPLSPPPVFGQVQVVVEHFLGRAATEVLHNAILLHIAEHADHRDVGTRTSTVHPKKGYSPECVEGSFSEGRARLRVVASCSSVANVDSLSRCSERREVSEEDNKAVVRRWIETFNNPCLTQRKYSRHIHPTS
jgi:hypothetical protein